MLVVMIVIIVVMGGGRTMMRGAAYGIGREAAHSVWHGAHHRRRW
jgi:hypothetical protein